jgi:CubicO group peptidase (beta-lactamase class C family)
MDRRAFLSAAGLAAFGLSHRPAFARPSKKPALALDRLMETTKVPGIAVAGMLDGNPIQLAGGVQLDTGFPAASLSKPVFAWAVRDLAKAGRLDWHKPLQDYLDLGLSGEARTITAEHVLTHSTGLTNWRFKADEQLATAFTPGSRWQYSGEGIFLLQRAVEKIVGVPIAAYMRDQVLRPMGMTRSTFAWTPEVQSRAAAGHDREGQAMERSLAFYEQHNHGIVGDGESATYEQILAAYGKAKAVALPIAMSPNMAGSLQTTAPDYARFLARVLADTAERPDDFRPRIDVNHQIAWTLGLGVDRSLGAPSFLHWGDGPGFKNFAWVQPARKAALVFLTNGDRGASLYAWVFRELLREDPAAFYWI